MLGGNSPGSLGTVCAPERRETAASLTARGRSPSNIRESEQFPIEPTSKRNVNVWAIINSGPDLGQKDTKGQGRIKLTTKTN